MRGIHSPGSTGKTWTCPPLPNSEAQSRGPVCRLPLVPSMLLRACPEPFPIILVLGGEGGATFLQEIDSSPLPKAFSGPDACTSGS